MNALFYVLAQYVQNQFWFIVLCEDRSAMVLTGFVFLNDSDQFYTAAM